MFSRWFRKYTDREKYLRDSIRRIIGATPSNLELYNLAMKHSSIAEENEQGFRESNERLEYLGDAVLGAVVAEYLFKRYPFKDEGFLTEIRSRIVNREALNSLAIKIGLSELVDYEGKRKSPHSHKSIFGDAFEAFIGALYLDKGFAFSRNFIIHSILMRHYDIDELTETTANFKSLIIEWAQKNSRSVSFDISEQQGPRNSRNFKVRLIVDGQLLAEGNGFSKKKAEQDAARKASDQLGLL